MTTFFRSLAFVVLILFPSELFLLSGAKAQSRGDGDVSTYTPVSYCELIRHAVQYDGRRVAVRASYRYGFEWQEMFCMKCRDHGKTWLEFESDTSSSVRRALRKARPGRARSTPHSTEYFGQNRVRSVKVVTSSSSI